MRCPGKVLGRRGEGVAAAALEWCPMPPALDVMPILKAPSAAKESLLGEANEQVGIK